MAEGLQGFLLVDKPSGWTSHDVVGKVRSLVGGKAGHAGTLDPMATGLLVVALGRATRLLRYVQGAEKEYVATAQFGVATDSLDADGSVISREPTNADADQIEAVLSRFRGDILQVPPMVSARKVEGRRLYALAREGKVVEREARPVTIHSLDLIDVAPSDYPEVTFRTVCSTGTYVRTLADDIARALGSRAHLTSLRRTRIGAFTVDTAASIDELVEAHGADGLDDLVMPSAAGVRDLPEVVVEPSEGMRVRNGVALPAADREISDGGAARILDAADRSLIAVYRRDGDKLKAEVVLS